MADDTGFSWEGEEGTSSSPSQRSALAESMMQPLQTRRDHASIGRKTFKIVWKTPFSDQDPTSYMVLPVSVIDLNGWIRTFATVDHIASIRCHDWGHPRAPLVSWRFSKEDLPYPAHSTVDRDPDEHHVRVHSVFATRDVVGLWGFPFDHPLQHHECWFSCSEVDLSIWDLYEHVQPSHQKQVLREVFALAE